MPVMIGLVHVRPRPGNSELGTSRGAFLTALAEAIDAADFKAKMIDELGALEFDVVEVEEVEPFDDRIAKFKVDPQLIVLAAEVGKLGGIRFGTFHSYKKDEP